MFKNLAGLLFGTLALTVSDVGDCRAQRCGCPGEGLDVEVERALPSRPTEPLPVIVLFRPGPAAVLLDRPEASQADKVRALRASVRRGQAAFLRKFEGRTAGEPRSLWLANAVALTASGEVLREMAAHPAVARVELDGPVRLPRPSSRAAGSPGAWTYGLRAMKVPEAREAFDLLGDTVTVGVIDSGVDATHPDLAGKVAAFKDFVNGRPAPYDDQGHGTHCCGTIAGGAASGTNIGVAPHVRLVVAKAFGVDGQTVASRVLDAMAWVVDPDGDPATPAPTVVSNSWTGGKNQQSFRRVVRTWVALGIFPCFIAGNKGPEPSSVNPPGGYPESFAVGATDERDEVASFSSRGPATWDDVPYVKPDVTAPGDQVYSAKPGGGYQTLSGTSMACPHVAGLVALLQQARPGLAIEDVRRALQSTALDLGEPGQDNSSGFGRVDALAALTAVALDGLRPARRARLLAADHR